MLLAKRLRGAAIAAYVGAPGQTLRGAVHQVRHRHRRHVLEVFLDPHDPWSFLVAQVTRRLVDATGVELEVQFVTPPASDVGVDAGMWARCAVRDARAASETYDVDFPGTKEADSRLLTKVCVALVVSRPPRQQLTAYLELAAAMWSHDAAAVDRLLGTWGCESTGAIAPALNEAYAGLRKRGHYRGAVMHWEGEWYVGIERASHLAEAMGVTLGRSVANVVGQRRLDAPAPLGKDPLSLEVWLSFRSPYSYLAIAQLSEDVDGDVGVRLRPVRPMVERGMEVPSFKQRLIVRDAKREADRLGVPFGSICDPRGAGIDHCITLAYWAEQRGPQHAFRWALSALRGIWSEARDMSDYVDLRFVAERAGLDWTGAREALTDPALAAAANAWATANAEELAVIGLWGVPSFRIGDLVLWGQDRLPVIKDRLRRHRLATS